MEMFPVLFSWQYIASANKLCFAAECEPDTQNYCVHQCQWREPSGLKYEILNADSLLTCQTEKRTEDLLRNRTLKPFAATSRWHFIVYYTI